MHLRISDHGEPPADLAQAQAYVGLVEEIGVGLVETADPEQRLPPERAVGPRQAEIALHLRTRRVQAGAPQVADLLRAAEAVRHDHFALVGQPCRIADVAADATHLRVGIGVCKALQPVGLGDRVVVQEGDDFAPRQAKPRVAGGGQVGHPAACHADALGVPGQHLPRPVLARSGHDDHLEVRMPLQCQGAERPIKPGRPIQGADDHRNRLRHAGRSRRGSRGWRRLHRLQPREPVSERLPRRQGDLQTDVDRRARGSSRRPWGRWPLGRPSRQRDRPAERSLQRPARDARTPASGTVRRRA